MNNPSLISRFPESRRALAFLFIAAAIILFFTAMASPYYILDEVRNGQAAREMFEKGEWIVPTFNGELRPQKPPLHYYFMHLAFSVLGTTAFAARFFSVVMGLLTLLVTYYFTKRFANARAAFWSVAVLVSSVHFLLEFHLSVPDPYLIFFFALALYGFYGFYVENKIIWLIISAVSLGLATLAKGPVAILLAGFIYFCWILINQPKKFLSFYWLLYAAITLLVAAPWFFLVHKATNGNFTRLFFFEQNLGRFSGAMEGHGGIFLIVPLIAFAGMLPFSVFIPAAIRSRSFRFKGLNLFSALAAVVVITFFCFSQTKLPNYAMPAYPFIAIFLGDWISKALNKGLRIKPYAFYVLFVLYLLMLAGAIFALRAEKALASETYYAIVFLLPVFTLIIIIQNYYKSSFSGHLSRLTWGFIVFNFIVLAIVYPAIYRKNPIDKTIGILDREQQVYAYEIYNPAYNFRLDKPVIILKTADEVKEKLKDPSVKIISRENLLPNLDTSTFRILAREKDLFENPVTVIIGGK